MPAPRSTVCLLATLKIWTCCALLLLTGCAGEESAFETLPVHPVSGKLTVNGEPAAGALLYFHRQEEIPHAELPIGRVLEDGTFSLTTYEPDDGAPVGEYVITIQWPKDPRAGPLSGDRLSRRFTNPKSSELRATVHEGENVLDPIALTGLRVEAGKAHSPIERN